MKLKTFFDKFDTFADAPDAVAKMRELVLQLAVTGKLVTQDRQDEPASVLLESTEAERAKLIAAKKIKSRTTFPVESAEQPFDLPSSWAWARLSDVGYELGQKVPDKRFTYIDVGGIDSDKGRISDRIEKLEPGDAPSRARKVVTRGTVIYSTVRPYLLNIAIVDQDFDPEPIASTAFGILHPFAGINNRYLFYWLRSAPFTAYVQAGMKGMAYPAINDEKFYSGFIALPPLAEQKRIVAKVDELMALCDRLEAQQQERQTRHAALARASLARFADAPTPANLNLLFHNSYTIPPADLRKSILTLAVQGKLVKQDYKDRSPRDSFPKLKPVAVESDDDYFPARWLRVPLRNTGEWRGGGTPSKSRPDFWKGDLPWVSPKDMKLLRIRDAQDHISTAAVEGSSVRLIPPGSLLMVVRGMILARAFPVALTMREVTINQDMKALLPAEPETGEFLLLALRAFEADVLAAIEHSSHGTCKLKTEFLQEFVMPIPPLAEQRRIVAKVDQLMALVDELETQLAASRATARNLLDALVVELTATEPQFAVAS
jgi:type I restriction enzyme S subunit